MTENLYHPDSIRTFTGKYVNPLNPDPDTICIEDIAHALSQICRFGGHTQFFYSVAEHSLDVASRVKIYKLTALLHDASEAYLCDIPSPVKKQIPGYAEAEDRLMKVIADKFGLLWPVPDFIKAADKAALEEEWQSLVLRGGVEPYTCERVKRDFLRTFEQLTR